jgi:hypothetical protein
MIVWVIIGLGIFSYLVYLIATIPTSDPWSDRFKAKCDSMYGVTYGDDHTLECFRDGVAVLTEKR